MGTYLLGPWGKIANLVPETKSQVLQMLEGVADVFRDKRGLTTVEEHRIDTGSAQPSPLYILVLCLRVIGTVMNTVEH